MFLCLTLFLAFSFKAVPVHAALIEAVYGTTPTIDGALAAGEWDDATTTFIGPVGFCSIFVKQDGSNLYIGTSIGDSTAEIYDEFVVALDTNGDETLNPQTDDYLLWVMRQPLPTSGYEHQGDGSSVWVWVGTPVGWTFDVTTSPTYWQAELSISYAKLGITPGVAKQIGIEFIVYDDSGPAAFYYWTAGADLVHPVSWGDIASTGYM